MISTNSQPSSPFQVRTLLCTVCYLAVLTSSHLIIPAWLLSGAEGLNQEFEPRTVGSNPLSPPPSISSPLVGTYLLKLSNQAQMSQEWTSRIPSTQTYSNDTGGKWPLCPAGNGALQEQAWDHCNQLPPSLFRTRSERERGDYLNAVRSVTYRTAIHQREIRHIHIYIHVAQAGLKLHV